MLLTITFINAHDLQFLCENFAISHTRCNSAVVYLSQSENGMWPILESNPRPPTCKSEALLTGLISPNSSHSLLAVWFGTVTCIHTLIDILFSTSQQATTG